MKVNIDGKNYEYGKIYKTKKYEMFELHSLNREVIKKSKHFKSLRDSMKDGWIEAYPIHCVVNGSGKLKIKAAHHRFEAAMDLGIEVVFVICNDDTPLWKLIRTEKNWNLHDVLTMFISDGNSEYIALNKFRENTGIGLSNCIQLLGGAVVDTQGGRSTSGLSESFKSGQFKIGNPTHANEVGDMVIYCRNVCKIPFSTNRNFVGALSRVLSLDEVNISTLKQKLKTNRGLMTKMPTMDGYIKLIEDVYNRNNKAKLPIGYMADQLSKKSNYIRISA